MLSHTEKRAKRPGDAMGDMFPDNLDAYPADGSISEASTSLLPPATLSWIVVGLAYATTHDASLDEPLLAMFGGLHCALLVVSWFVSGYVALAAGAWLLEANCTAQRLEYGVMVTAGNADSIALQARVNQRFSGATARSAIETDSSDILLSTRPFTTRGTTTASGIPRAKQ